MAAKPLLISGLRKTIGSCFNTRVWSKPWVPDVLARPPKGVLVERDPLLYVNALIDYETKLWKVKKIHEIFSLEEIPSS